MVREMRVCFFQRGRIVSEIAGGARRRAKSICSKLCVYGAVDVRKMRDFVKDTTSFGVFICGDWGLEELVAKIDRVIFIIWQHIAESTLASYAGANVSFQVESNAPNIACMEHLFHAIH